MKCLAALCLLTAPLLGQASAPSSPSTAPGEGVRVPPEHLGPVVERYLHQPQGAHRGVDVVRRHGVRVDRAGAWYVPPRPRAPRAHSGTRALINEWGDPRMTIGFGGPVDLLGAYVATAGGVGAGARTLHAVGYRGSEEVARTEPFVLEASMRWFPMALIGVDRVELVAAPGVAGLAGWFALDDLRFRRARALAETQLDFEDVPWRTRLAAGYAGLDWPAGRGFAGAGESDGRRPSAGSSELESSREFYPSVTVVPAPLELPPVAKAEGMSPGPRTGLSAALDPPNIVESFDGPKIFDAGGGAIPPDTCGAIGERHFVSITNFNLSAYRRSDRRRVLSIGIDTLFGAAVGDPRVVYDHHSRRFWAIGSDGPRQRRIYLAVSKTSDPTGAWFSTWFVAGIGPDANKWADYPTLGVDARGVYVAALMVGGSYPMSIWAIDKAPLLAATPQLVSVTAWRGLPFEGAIQPCVTFGDPGGEYLVSVRNSSNLMLRRIDGPLTAPTLTTIGPVSVPTFSRSAGSPALGSTVRLATGDTRLMNAVYRDGSVWAAHAIQTSQRAACRWYEVDVGRVATAQVGLVSDPVRHYFFPSIAVNARGDAVLGCSGAHSGEYGSAWVTGRLGTDPSGTMAPPILLKGGEGPYQRLDGNGTNRWGDYSLTTIDPLDDLGFWTIQEYARRGSSNLWGTWIARLDYSWFPYGTGLSGSIQLPTVRLDTAPRLGTSPTLSVDTTRFGSVQAVLVFGGRRVSVPLFGGTLLADPVVALNVTIPFPKLFRPFPIPNDPQLDGRSVFLQAVAVDPGAAQGFAFSRGLQLRLVK